MAANTYRGAHHEAAHAVVAARLGLPLDYIRRSSSGVIGGRDGLPSSIPEEEVAGESCGFTTLVEGTGNRGVDALPDPDARENLEKFGAHSGRGPISRIPPGEPDKT